MNKRIVAGLVLAGAAFAMAGGCAEIVGLEPPGTGTGGTGGAATESGGDGQGGATTASGGDGQGGATTASGGTGGACTPPMDVKGDCHKPDCVDGQPAQVVDDTDTDDGNPCTSDVCTQGTAQHPNLADHSSCPGGMVCSAGVCVGCIDPSDCSGSCCQNQVCSAAPAGCTDGCKNNGEPDVDCGSPPGCALCPVGKHCNSASDCQTGFCDRLGNCAECDQPTQCAGGVCCVMSGNCGACP